MRKFTFGLGLVLLVLGLSGTLDRIFYQPFFGVVLNSFNRFVVPNVAVLANHPIFANLTLAALGAILAIAACRSPRKSG